MSARAYVLMLGLALAWPRPAQATTSSCANANDGTPCIGVCVQLGTCQAQVCVAGTLRPDGTPCSSENVCTVGDQCLAGVCVPGAARVCPDKSSCEQGVCNSHIGCTFKNVCPPDLAGVDSLGGGFSPPEDLLGLDLTGLDLCTVPPGSEFLSCDSPDGQYYVLDDAGTDGGADGGVPFHVRGSRVGDCTFGGGAARDSLGVALLLLAVLAAAWRSRKLS